MELREEVLDRIISIMNDIKREYPYIYNKNIITLTHLIKYYSFDHALQYITTLFNDTLHLNDKKINNKIVKYHYEILYCMYSVRETAL